MGWGVWELTYVRDGNGLVGFTTEILEQVLDQDGALGNRALDLHVDTIGGGDADELDALGVGGSHDSRLGVV
jgi:hypothetical protein